MQKSLVIPQYQRMQRYVDPIDTVVYEVTLTSTSGSSYILDNFILSTCIESNIDISRVLMLEAGAWNFTFTMYGVEDTSLVIDEMINIESYVTPLSNILNTIYVKRPLYFTNVIPITTEQKVSSTCTKSVVAGYNYPRKSTVGIPDTKTTGDFNPCGISRIWDSLKTPVLDRNTSFEIKKPGDYYIYSTFDSVEAVYLSTPRSIGIELYLVGPIAGTPTTPKSSGTSSPIQISSSVTTTGTLKVLSDLRKVTLPNSGRYYVYARFVTNEASPGDITVNYGKVSLDVIQINENP